MLALYRKISPRAKTIAYLAVLVLTIGLFALGDAVNGDSIGNFLWPRPPVPTSTLASGHTPVSFRAITGAARGGQASATIRSSSNTDCALWYQTPRGAWSTARGQNYAQSTDGNGLATWSWAISPSTDPGLGKVFAHCGDTEIVANIPIH